MTGLIRSAAGRAAVTEIVMATVLVASGLVSGPALAQDVPPANSPTGSAASAADDYPPPEEAQAAPDIAPIPITTIATGGKLPLDNVAQSVTVLTSDDLERIGGADFTRALALIPGVTWTRDGAQGTDTQVHMRGSEASDVLVTIDGVRMNDVAGMSGGYDFGTLTMAGIERIDVLRGSNSLIWGSGAIGGVIALTTPETKGVLASIETGSRDNVAENLAVGLKKDRYALAFNIGYVANDDIPAPRIEGSGGFHQWHLAGRGRYSLTDTLSFVATARYADGKQSGNGFPLPLELTGDAAAALETEQFSGRAGAHFEKGGVALDAGYALATTRRVYVAQNEPGDVTAIWLGRSERVDLTGSVKLPAGFLANFGADDEWTGYSGSYDSEHRARIDSGHLLLGWCGPVATLAAGLRVDDHSQFGSHDSFSANGSLKLLEGVRLRGSYADGFKAPTLYQLWSAYGNAGLAPETAESYDAGVEYSGDDGRVRLTASVYRRDSRNLIAFVGCAGMTTSVCSDRSNGTFANVGVARADGVELEATLVPTSKLRIAALYSYDHATDRTPGAVNRGKLLARRPQDAVTASIDWTSPFKGVVLGLDTRVQTASWDDAANTVRLGPSELTTLRASLPFGRFIDFYGRIENLFNDHTPTVAGYGAVGRGVFAGIRVRY